jgi:ribose/xylose/arabinose/galactoside ABC-type transport system permease subunit
MSIAVMKASERDGSSKLTLGETFRKYGSFLTLIIVFIAASLLSENFLTPTNIFLVLRQTSVLGIVAIGQTFVILTGGTDLSVTSVLSMTLVLFTGLYNYNDANWLPILAIALGIGLIAGLVNGYLISRLKIPPIVMTLGMQTLLLGGGLIFSKGVPGNELTDNFRFIGLGSVGIVPFPVIVWGLVLLVAIIILYFTNYGRYVYAVGGNPEAAKFSGINVENVTMGVYVLSAICACIAGIVLGARIGTGDNYVGSSLGLDSIAAVVIGGTSFTGGRGGVITTVAGVLIMAILYNLLLLMGVVFYFQEVVKGLVILIGVIVYTSRNLE